jgi:hypothetical protein
MIADKISTYLADTNSTVNEYLCYQVEKLSGWAFRRQFMSEAEDRSGSISLSACGKCPRQLAYNYLGIEKNGKEVDRRSRLLFFQGDVVELTLMSLARLAGCNLIGTGMNQITLKVNIEGKDIFGHPDGFLIEDGTRLVECKSMNSYAFERFENSDIDDAYNAQINMYLEASNLDECIMLAMNKDNAVVKECIVYRDPILINNIKNNLATVLKSTKENMPPPPDEFRPDAKGYYPWNCLYCNFWGHCRVGAQRVLVGKSYKLKTT